MTTRQRFATRRTQETNGIDRLPLHAIVRVVDHGLEIAEQPVIAWCGLIEDVNGLDSNVGGGVLQQGSHGRYGFAGSRTEVTEGSEGSGFDIQVGVSQAGRQLLHGTRSQGANLSQRQGRTASDARTPGL